MSPKKTLSGGGWPVGVGGTSIFLYRLYSVWLGIMFHLSNSVFFDK